MSRRPTDSSAAAAGATPAAAPLLRLLPAPATDPPYDDEVPPSAVLLRSAPVSLSVAPPLRVVATPPDDGDGPSHCSPRKAGEHEDGARPRTPLRELAPPHPFTHALVQRLLEVLSGVRPVSQLQRHTTPELYEQLQQHVAALPRWAGPRPDARAVRSVHVQARADGVVEACSTVRRQTPRGVRVQALALRLEGLDGRWCCTELLGL